MAKKKVTRKKTRATARRGTAAKKSGKKKKTAAKVSKKRARKPVARKTSVKKKSTAKKSAAKKPAAAKTKKKKKTAARAAAAKKTTVKKKTVKKTAKKAATVTKAAGTKKTSRRSRAAAPPRPAPDANGYVIINGRRVRMMSAASAANGPNAKKVRTRTRSNPTPSPDDKGRKPVRTKLSKKDLVHYRTLLLIKRAELVGDLSAMEANALQSAGGHLSHMPIHMADVGTDTFDQDFMLGMAENERRRLREIDDALKRIENKTYGICEMTDKVIPKTRLNAKPWARHTIEAARELERGVGE